MTVKNNIRQKLIIGLDNMAPDVYENIVSVKQERITSEEELFGYGNTESGSRGCRAGIYRYAFALVIFFIMVGTILNLNIFNAGSSNVDKRYIYVDVNPSIRVYVDKNNKATEIKALNDDAADIVKDIPDNLSEDKAMQRLVDRLRINGYFDKNKAMLLSVNKELDDEYDTIIDNIQKYINSQNLGVRVIARRINSNDKNASTISKKYKISYGKASFIEDISKENNNVSVNELAGLNITQILEKVGDTEEIAGNIKESAQDDIILSNIRDNGSGEESSSGGNDKNYGNVKTKHNDKDTENILDSENEKSKDKNSEDKNSTNESNKNVVQEISENDKDITAGGNVADGKAETSTEDSVTEDSVTDEKALSDNAILPEGYGYIEDGLVVVPQEDDDDGLSKSEDIPDKYDSRDKNIVSSVKNQDEYGSMGSCWTFSTMAVSEVYLAYKLGMTEDEVNLSEMQLLYFAYHRVADPLGGTYGDVNSSGSSDYRKLGGNYALSVTSLSSWMGPVDEKLLSYDNVANESLVVDESLAYGNTFAHMQNSRMASMTDMDIVKVLIMEEGAVQVTYKHLSTAYNASNGAYYNNDKSRGTNHAVTIVGWDDNYSRDNFRIKPDTDGAWLVKNSWGASKGDNGYIWISYSDASLMGQAAYTYEYEKADNYEYNYQYDGCADIGNSISYGNDSCYMANVFTAKSNEVLKAVSFYLLDVNMQYEIQIYKGLKDSNNPTSGIAQFSKAQSGEEVLQGYYTVPLDKEVNLSAGEKYSVVIKLIDNGGVAMVPAETSEKVGFTTTAYSEKGQSFTSNTGEIWTDRGTKGNVRIKAFTNKREVVELNPVKVSTVQNKNSYVAVSWNKCDDATGYKIYRKDSVGQKYILVANVKKKCTYVDKNVKTGTKYNYYVKAYYSNSKEQYESGKSNVSSILIKLDTPTLNTKTTGVNGVLIKWDKVKKASGYEIYRADKKNAQYTRIATVNGNIKKYRDRKVSGKETKCVYKIRAFYRSGGKKVYSKYSNIK